VDDFLYQLQEVDLEALADAAYDLVIIDYSADGTESGEFRTTQIAALHASPTGPKIVLAYLSIGEAEDYRFYWQDGWRPGAPAWLHRPNSDWPGNYRVDYWDPQWQAIILGYVDRLVAAGFDGAYLDLIDAYEGATEDGRMDAAQEMAEFIALIRAHARASDPDFLIFVQNGAALVRVVPGYLDSVDGIGQEDIYYGYEADDVLTPPEVTAELERQLDCFLAAGKLVLTVDYATIPAHIDRAYARARARSYVPFVTVRELDRLTVNPGHEPD
jgi:cysteinyl-tRNA synthetase